MCGCTWSLVQLAQISWVCKALGGKQNAAFPASKQLAHSCGKMSEQPSNAKTHCEIMAFQSSFCYPKQPCLRNTGESGEGTKGVYRCAFVL